MTPEQERQCKELWTIKGVSLALIAYLVGVSVEEVGKICLKPPVRQR